MIVQLLTLNYRIFKGGLKIFTHLLLESRGRRREFVVPQKGDAVARREG